MTFHIRSIQSYIGLFAIILFAAACSKKEEVVAPPSLSNVEIGSGNNKTGYAGGDIHIEAEIMAPGKIASVRVTIHPKAGSGWEFDTTYTEGFTGLLNAEIHEHIHIPIEAPSGDYHLDIVVTDQQGKTTGVESDIKIVLDPTLPSIENFEVELSEDGTDLHIEGDIHAEKKIAKVAVEIHGGDWEKEVEYTDAAMVGQTAYSLHKHIDIADAPAGHYHVHVKITDQAGREREFEEHFDKP